MRQRRYVRLPEDCVSLCMENLGIQASREVTSVLVEDVSFRIRQVTKVSQLDSGVYVWTGYCNSPLSLTAGTGICKSCKSKESLQRGF